MAFDFDHPDDAAHDIEVTCEVVVEGRSSHVGVRDELVSHNDGARRQCSSHRTAGPWIETAPMVWYKRTPSSSSALETDTLPSCEA